MAQGLDVNTRDRTDGTALLSACTKGRREVAALLLEHGAEVDPADRHGLTPLTRGHRPSARGGRGPQRRDAAREDSAAHRRKRPSSGRRGAPFGCWRTRRRSRLWARVRERVPVVRLLLAAGAVEDATPR